MGNNVYDVVKAPIGCSLFCNRDRIGGYCWSEEALDAGMAFSTRAVREGSGIPVNAPAPEPDASDVPAWPGRSPFDLNSPPLTTRTGRPASDPARSCQDCRP